MSCRKPCKECPFAKTTPPGATGGADPSVYVGQAEGPFLLPCHMDPRYEIDRRSPNLLQCAGAGAYRANMGIDKLLPVFFERFEPDRKRAFATPAELIAHHRGVSLEEAQRELDRTPRSFLLERELTKTGMRVLMVERRKRLR